jgi:hypothetical protein
MPFHAIHFISFHFISIHFILFYLMPYHVLSCVIGLFPTDIKKSREGSGGGRVKYIILGPSVTALLSSRRKKQGLARILTIEGKPDKDDDNWLRAFEQLQMISLQKLKLCKHDTQTLKKKSAIALLKYCPS